MRKILVFYTLILSLTFLAGCANVQGKMILFYRDDCPHCKNVEAFIEKNNIKDKVDFEMKEVKENQDNALLLIKKAASCGLPTDQIGVPFFWDGFKCIVGDELINKFFEEKIK